jgi:RNA 3'-terminal phosphate cyclase (ATP)
MSVLTQQPVRVDNIRGGTKFPGLDIEDLVIARALAESSAAEMRGADIGSNTLAFFPGRKAQGLNGRLGEGLADESRRPNGLVVMNCLLPILARAGMYSSVAVEGETYGTHTLGYDYFANVTLAVLKRMGLYAFCEMPRAGFGRESAGVVTLDVEPSAVEPISWMDRGRQRSLAGVVATAGVPDAIGSRGVAHLKALAKNAGMTISASHQRVSGGPGAYVTVWCAYDKGMGGGAAMGSRGVRIEALAQTAFEETYQWMSSSGTIDPYLADQILLPAIVAGGDSAFRVSKLTRRFVTSVWVVKQFVPIHITVKGSENGPGEVTVRKG